MKRLSKLFGLLFVIMIFVLCFVGCVNTKVATFMVNGKETIKVIADKDGKMKEPKVEIPDGYYIEGWCSDLNCSIPFDFEKDIISKDTTLYAKLNSYDFSVTYNLGYTAPEHGEDMPSAPIQNTVNLNDTFVVADVPNRVGYDFLGWTDGTDIYQPGDVYEVEVTGNITLTATWTTKMFTVKFFDDVGEMPITKEVPYGSDIIEPDAPHTYPIVYTHVGWDKSLTNITQNLEVHALYEYAADDSYFEFVPVLNDSEEIIAYKVKMPQRPEPEWSWDTKRFDEDGIWAFPAYHENKPVIGFAQAWEDVGMDYNWGYSLDISVFFPETFESIDFKTMIRWHVNTIYITSGLKHIDKYAFNNNIIKNWEVYEDNQYFYGDGSNLYNKDKSVLLHADYEEINLVIDDDVKIISANLLNNSDKLETVTIKGDVEKIEAGAFASCYNLREVTIEGSVKILEDGHDIATGYLDYSKQGVFYGCLKLGSINLKGTEHIGFSAFVSCWELSSVILDTSLKYVSPESFENIPKLKTLKFEGDATLSDDGKYLCQNNTLIAKGESDILLSDGVTKGDVFILYAPAQERLHYDVPNTVTEFYEYAFENASFETIIIPEGIKELPGGLFMFSKLKSITIPASVETLGVGNESCGSSYNYSGSPVFMGSDLSEGVTFALGSHIEVIPRSTFFACKFTSICIPASVREIGEYAITNDILESISVEEGNEVYGSLDGVLYNTAITEILCYPASKKDIEYVAPDTLKKLNEGSFSFNLYVKTFIANEGLEDIGPSAFDYAEFTDVYFSSTIQRVDISSFYSSWYLKNVTFDMEQPFTVTNLKEQEGLTLFNVAKPLDLSIKVAEAKYKVFYDFIEQYAEGYGDLIDASNYADENVTRYLFVSQGVTTVVKAKKLLKYSPPEWTGEGTMYFNGYFKDEGTWLEEIVIPAVNAFGTSVTYYAKWSETPREDGTAEWFALSLPVNSEAITIHVTAERPKVYFKTLIDPGQEYNFVKVTLYINGGYFGDKDLYPTDIPENKIWVSYLDFSDLLWLPADVTLMLTMTVFYPM